jgi:hypothetical protein
VDGLCRVTVGYNSSAAGTNSGRFGVGTATPLSRAFWSVMFATTAKVPSGESGGELLFFFEGFICRATGIRVVGGIMGAHGTPFTLKVTVAVTRSPSQVSTADSSSRHTRHPTVAPSVKAAREGFIGVHHWPATRICPVVQRPHEPCQAPTNVFFGISSVDSPTDRVAIIVCRIGTGPSDRGRTIFAKRRCE